MVEGWYDEDYFVLFDDAEVADFSRRYDIGTYLPGFRLIGFKGWDDFILANPEDMHFTVPAVPLDSEHLEPFETPLPFSQLSSDDRFTGKIKWYVKPIVFGGDPVDEENIKWVSLDQHAELVTWWNKVYYKAKREQADR